MKKLHPNAKVLFYLSMLISLGITGAFISIFTAIPIAGNLGFSLEGVFTIVFYFLIGLILIPLPLAHLMYENFKYEVQGDKLHIEKGIIWKKYVSIPFDRVQNIDIIRGPLARLLELSDLHIQTAGATQIYVEGRIPGLSEADAIALKDEILSKVRGKKSL